MTADREKSLIICICQYTTLDVQQFLPNASPEEVKEKVNYTSRILGKQGGYVLSGSHHLQADIPLENVLAMYGII